MMKPQGMPVMSEDLKKLTKEIMMKETDGSLTVEEIDRYNTIALKECRPGKLDFARMYPGMTVTESIKRLDTLK